MTVEVAMPKLGWTMEEGVLVEWLKKDGDAVNAGDILFTVESDKALQEVEAFDSGILRIPPDSPAPGSRVKVGARLAYIIQPGEPVPFEPQAAAHAPAPDAAVQRTASATPISSITSNADKRNAAAMPNISPRARRIAAELGVNWTGLKGSGRTGRIVERDIRAAAARSSSTIPLSIKEERTTIPPTISPVAQRAAQELGVDRNTLAARFPGKRITREDVEQVAKEQAASSPALPVRDGGGEAARRTPLSPTRRVIAQRMSESAHTTAPVTLTTEVDATELVRMREQLKADRVASQQPIPTYTDLLAKLAAHALQEHPHLNARLEGEEIVSENAVHIGIAVDTERGLLVPVLRNVQDKSLRQLAAEAEELTKSTRAGQVRGDELRGSTFTITNLGMYEIDSFTPIINLPECAILGVGRIVSKQVVIDDSERVAVRRMMFLSLTFDHRLVDGAPAARFLQRIKQLVEQPYLWLVN